jgi:hypothetical protein
MARNIIFVGLPKPGKVQSKGVIRSRNMAISLSTGNHWLKVIPALLSGEQPYD